MRKNFAHKDQKSFLFMKRLDATLNLKKEINAETLKCNSIKNNLVEKKSLKF